MKGRMRHRAVRNLTKVTQLISSRARMQTQVLLALETIFLTIILSYRPSRYSPSTLGFSDELDMALTLESMRCPCRNKGNREVSSVCRDVSQAMRV